MKALCFAENGDKQTDWPEADFDNGSALSPAITYALPRGSGQNNISTRSIIMPAHMVALILIISRFLVRARSI